MSVCSVPFQDPICCLPFFLPFELTFSKLQHQTHFLVLFQIVYINVVLFPHLLKNVTVVEKKKSVSGFFIKFGFKTGCVTISSSATFLKLNAVPALTPASSPTWLEFSLFIHFSVKIETNIMAQNQRAIA